MLTLFFIQPHQPATINHQPSTNIPTGYKINNKNFCQKMQEYYQQGTIVLKIKLTLHLQIINF